MPVFAAYHSSPLSFSDTPASLLCPLSPLSPLPMQEQHSSTIATLVQLRGTVQQMVPDTKYQRVCSQLTHATKELTETKQVRGSQREKEREGEEVRMCVCGGG